MSKKKWSLLLAIFFLVQEAICAAAFSSESNPLNAPTKVNINCPDTRFSNLYDAICLGIFFYKLDAVGRCSKDEIIRDHGNTLLNSDVRFDLANIDLTGKGGYTRYYPFSITGKSFIMRIFLTEELQLQPKVKVLYEGTLNNPAVTFQILPSLNDILSDCKIKPIRIYFSPETSRSP